MFTVWTAPDSVRLTAGWWRWWCWVGAGPGDAMLQWSSLLVRDLAAGTRLPRTPRSCTPHHHQCLRGEESRNIAANAHRPPVAALNIGSDWDINSREDGLEESKDPKIPWYHCSYVMTRWMMMLRKTKFLVWSDGWSAITFLFSTLRNNELSYYLTLLWTQTYQNVERWVK